MPFALARAEDKGLPFDPAEFAPAPAPSGALGPALRAAREAGGRSLSDLSGATRIGEHYLRALEETRLSDFAGRVYALGFARSYARELGLPADWADARMREEIDRNPPSWRRSGWYV